MGRFERWEELARVVDSVTNTTVVTTNSIGGADLWISPAYALYPIHCWRTLGRA